MRSANNQRAAASARTPDDVPAWHLLPEAEVTRRLGVDAQGGLTTADAEHRALVHGPNAVREAPRRHPWRMLLDQFSDFMILILIAAAVLSGVIGDPEDAAAIVVIVLVNGVIGFVQEYRAERAVAALQQLAAPSATARRDGGVVTVPAAQLVPGDIVLLDAGNVVPADLRLLEVALLTVDESVLTGESVPVEKRSVALARPTLLPGDRVNMAYKGTVVTRGRAVGVVVAIGMETELGRIATLLSGAEEHKTPLQLRLTRFGQRLALAAIAVCAVVFVAGMLRGESPLLMLLTAVSLAVAAIPEALPAVVTVSLALGARRMVSRQALIRRLPAVETLGSVTYVCADKTGTLTQNRMQVERYWIDAAPAALARPPDPAIEPWCTLLTILAVSNDAARADDGQWHGDPTEAALCQAAADAGLDKAALIAALPRIAELPFDADRKCMTTVHRAAGGIVAFTKGAPEGVLARCGTALQAGGTVPVQARPIAARAEAMAADGLRVLAVAQRHWPALPSPLSAETVECDLTFVGLIGLLDPPRAEAREAVARCRSAGITPVMITGDHPATARSIAARVGIGDGADTVLTGEQLAELDAAALPSCVAGVRVYARVAPEQKIRIVTALQARGEFVAMTGDGVNDAPALQQADIGVAMGRTGTDVAREAADMILLDDNFATIVGAISEGRRIFDNVRKFIRYAVTCNSAEIWTMFLAPFFGLPIPLLPIQILWINLVTDGLPGVALAVEPPERGIMDRPPRPPRESLFAHGMWQHIIWVGLLMAGVSLLSEVWGSAGGPAQWRTMVFTVLALSQMGHVLAIRSERESLVRQGLWTNRPLLGAVVLTVALQLMTIYVPAARAFLKTEPLPAAELVVCLTLSCVVFVAVEIEKWMVRRGWIYQLPARR